MFYIGCHLSVSEGYEGMGKTALSIGANTFQYFTRNPRGRGFRRPSKEDVAALVKLMEANGVDTTELMSNFINHPTREMHNLFAFSLVETMMR